MNRRTFSLRGVIAAVFAPVVARDAGVSIQPYPSAPPTLSGRYLGDSVADKLKQSIVTPLMPDAFKAYLAHKQSEQVRWMRRDLIQEVMHRMPHDIDVLKLPRQAKINMAIDRAHQRSEAQNEVSMTWFERLGFVEKSVEPTTEELWRREYMNHKYNNSDAAVSRNSLL